MDRKVYLEDLPLEEAFGRFMDHLRRTGALEPCRAEVIPVEEAQGRVTAGPVYARLSSPHYNASGVDGVAVRSQDTYGASETSPVHLAVGEQAAVVDTGDPLPPGFDAVIMIEDVHWVREGVVEIIEAVPPRQHVRVVGEDFVAADMLLPAGHTVRPVDIGALITGGVREIAVRARPRVALLPTGTELVELAEVKGELKPGDIIESNSRMLAAMVREWGGEPLRYPITVDDPKRLKEAVARAAGEADIVLVGSGSSAGREDYTSAVIEELGRVLVHGVAIKPGKPVILGEVAGKPAVGVPGYPVSAWLCAELFVRPLVYAKLGASPPARQPAEAVLSRKIVSPIGVEEFVRVVLGRVGGKIIATPVSRGAGVLTSLVRSDGVLRVPRQAEGCLAGETVRVELFRGLSEIEETTVITGSHDISLDVLASFLRQRFPGASLSSAHVGSLGGLAALLRGEAHCAGIHLLDGETGEYNLPYVKRILPGREVVLVNLAYREQGLMVAPGNPKNIRGLEDLARGDVVFVNRQRGAGTRVFLDYAMRRLGIDPKEVRGYSCEEYTHTAVAAAVAAGMADAGLGIKAAARALGLDFVGVAWERYDLCVPAEFWDTPHIQRLLEVMADPAFRQEVEALGGYDTKDCGQVIYRG